MVKKYFIVLFLSLLTSLSWAQTSGAPNSTTLKPLNMDGLAYNCENPTVIIGEVVDSASFNCSMSAAHSCHNNMVIIGLRSDAGTCWWRCATLQPSCNWK